jgi:hypothetical protein
MGQVLIWVSDTDHRPTQEQWNAARQLPPSTTLREVLAAMGIDADREVARLW